MRLILYSFILLTALPQALPAAPPAAQVPPSKQVDPATLQAADRLLTAMNYDQMMERTCEAMIAQTGPILRSSIESKTGQPVDDELIKQLSDIQGDFMRQVLIRSPNLRRAVVTIYASHFTGLELGRLTELYKDPVMRKWTDVTPAATAEMLPLIHALMDSRREELEGKVKAAVIDYYAKKKEATAS